MNALAVFPLVGLVAGAMFFGLLRWNASLYTRGGKVALALVIQVTRVAVLGGLLALTARYGALQLLLTALGSLIARPIGLRMAGGAA